MPLGLRHLNDMDQLWHMLLSRRSRRFGVGLNQSWIVPSANNMDVVPIRCAWLALESRKKGSYVGLRDLHMVRHRNTVPIIPDRDHSGCTQHADGIDRLPKHPLRTRSITDRAEGDFIAVRRKGSQCLQLFDITIDNRGVGKTNKARHLRTRWRDVGRDIVSIGLRQPLSALIEEPRCEMAVHGTTGGGRLC